MDDNIKEEVVYADWQYLLTTSDGNEAAVIESILQSEHVPVLKKSEGLGDYMHIFAGQTRFAVKIYVPNECLEEAKAIILSGKSAATNETEEDHNTQYGLIGSIPISMKIGRTLIWIIIILFFIVLFGYVIYNGSK